MSNVFDFNRFGKYFVYDMKNAFNKGRVSLMVFSLLPAFMILIVQIWTLLTRGSFNEGVALVSAQFSGFAGALIASSITMPSRLYGDITEKRYGSSWLMIPASTFEKWLSMILVLCVVLPLVLAVALFGIDSICSLVFGNYYHGAGGSMMLMSMKDFPGMPVFVKLNMNPGPAVYFEWVETSLAFALGAVVFLRAKVGKTIFAFMALGMLTSMVAGPILTHLDVEDFEFLAGWISGMSGDQLVRTLKLGAEILEAGLIAALVGGIYYRLRTIKH